MCGGVIFTYEDKLETVYFPQSKGKIARETKKWRY